MSRTRGYINSPTVGISGSGASMAFDALDIGESTFPRALSLSQTTLTSQLIRFSYFAAGKTETITQVRIFSGGTAAGATPTLVRVGIYSVAANGDLTLVASTANDTTLLASPNTAYTKALQASWNKTAGNRYAIGLLVVTAATAPVVPANAPATGPASEYTTVTPTLSSNIAGQTDLPASIAVGSLSVSAARPYVVVLP